MGITAEMQVSFLQVLSLLEKTHDGKREVALRKAGTPETGDWI